MWGSRVGGLGMGVGERRTMTRDCNDGCAEDGRWAL